MHMNPFTHDVYRKAYMEDGCFKELYQHLQGQVHMGDGDITIGYKIHNGLLYRLDTPYVPKAE